MTILERMKQFADQFGKKVTVNNRTCTASARARLFSGSLGGAAPGSARFRLP